MQAPIQFRTLDLNRETLDKEQSKISVSFSSEYPVERYFGIEVLDHSPGSADLTRLNAGGPVLVGHNSDDQVGVVEHAKIDSSAKRGFAVLRFSQSARGREIWGDVADGIRKNISVGYRINEMELVKKDESGVGTYRVTSYTPLEISVVSVPADPTIGVGRSEERMFPIKVKIPEGLEAKQDREVTMSEEKTTPAPDNTDQLRAQVKAEYEKENKARIQNINASVERWKDDERYDRIQALGRRAIEEGMSPVEFKDELLGIVANRDKPVAKPRQDVFGEGSDLSPIGMNEREVQQFSIVRAIQKIIAKSEGRASKLDGLEFEASEAYIKRAKIQPNGQLVIPPDVLMSRWRRPTLTRDQIVATATLGGNLVATDLLAANFIDILRARMVTARMGATVLDGLQGNVVIPRQAAAAAWGWVAETTASSELSITVDQVTLTPLTLTGFVDYNKQLLLQSTPSIDDLVRRDINAGIAVALDLAALHGAGAPAPTGLAGLSTNSVTGGANGATVTWANVVNMEREVGIDNADMGALGYVTNSQQRANMKTILRDTAGGGFIWTDGATGTGEGMINGYRALASQQVASNLTKGTSTTVCSAIFFGNWADMLIGLWGGLDILVDPYSQSSSRVVRVVATQYADVDVRHLNSFCSMLDAL